ncbi:MAG: Stp1/IreP family PP2C-type Ser/Thr phosphatase [Defluviitaleaceae bacterium]|nr:Stp1/IreP family PP2C-type Ser/Thr phosphatase [Defluviitaleaceae bacterium]
MNIAGLTAIGMVRSHNEDTIYFTTNKIGPLPNLFVVADGMGGHNAGEVASAKSLEFFCDFIRNSQLSPTQTPEETVSLLVAAVDHANKEVYEYSLTSPTLSGMGTTFSACVVLDGKLAVAHIGDSRIYTVHNSDITQITVDHTYVAEMVLAGNLTPANAKTHPNRNQLTRVLGCKPPINVDGTLHDLQGIASVLLCSDGLTDMLHDSEIMHIATHDAPTQARAQALIDAANNNGGIDNISAIIIDVKGETN